MSAKWVADDWVGAGKHWVKAKRVRAEGKFAHVGIKE